MYFKYHTNVPLCQKSFQTTLQAANYNILLIAVAIEFHIYQYAFISEIILTIKINGSNYNRIARHFILQWLLMININAQIVFIPLQKLNTKRIVFHKSYQLLCCQKSLLNITLKGSNYNRWLRQIIQWWLLMMYINVQIIFFPSWNSLQ